MVQLYDVSSSDRFAQPGDKMTMRENAEAILKGEQPEYYFDIMSAATIVPDPHFVACAIPKDGEEHVDPWGVTRCFLPTAPGAHHRREQGHQRYRGLERSDYLAAC